MASRVVDTCAPVLPVAGGGERGGDGRLIMVISM